MLAIAFVPSGIVAGALRSEVYTPVDNIDDNMTTYARFRMPGVCHIRVFYDEIAVVWQQMDHSGPDPVPEEVFQAVECQWDHAPHIADFMDAMLEEIIARDCNMVGFAMAYDTDFADDSTVPFVYEIAGRSIQRVNADEEGRPQYHFITSDPSRLASRLFDTVMTDTGQDWAEAPAPRLHCAAFSLEKARDICRFALRTQYYMEELNSALTSDPVAIETVEVTPEGIFLPVD